MIVSIKICAWCIDCRFNIALLKLKDIEINLTCAIEFKTNSFFSQV